VTKQILTDNLDLQGFNENIFNFNYYSLTINSIYLDCFVLNTTTICRCILEHALLSVSSLITYSVPCILIMLLVKLLFFSVLFTTVSLSFIMNTQSWSQSNKLEERNGNIHGNEMKINKSSKVINRRIDHGEVLYVKADKAIQISQLSRNYLFHSVMTSLLPFRSSSLLLCDHDWVFIMKLKDTVVNNTEKNNSFTSNMIRIHGTEE
jgi:membrane protein implicated in regulation of membrane protease activity